MSNPKQLHLNVKIDESITLENFITCSSTKLVLEVFNNFIYDPTSFKTIYLWGKRGVGKNYLLQAANKEFIKNKLNSTFFSFLSNSVEDPSILEGLEELDIILFEGMDRFPKKKEWEVALFNLINACLAKGSKIIFSSSQVSKDLGIELPDLKSRLVAIPAFELPELTEKEKISALKESAQRKGLMFEERVLTYIINHTSRSLSDLLKLMFDLDIFSLERKRKISISLVRDLLANKEDNPST